MDVVAQKVILILIDTLRSDHLGCYGYPLPTSPILDQFSRHAVLYQYAFSPSSYTIPVHAAIFTGRIPTNHSLWFWQGRGRLNLDRDITLAEVLRTEGYQTGAFVGSYILRKDWGLNAGFATYNDRMTAREINRSDELIRDGKETNQAIFDALGEKPPDKFFYFIHYFDVHGPYMKDGYKDVFHEGAYGDRPSLLEEVPDGMAGGIPSYELLGARRDGQGNLIEYERDARVYMARYDAGIRYCDEVIGELLDHLKRVGVYDDALIVVTSDHGEALGENNVYFFHGLTVSIDQIRIPLLVKYPGENPTGHVVNTPVTSLDIMPTLLDACGIDLARFRLDGKSLLRNSEKLSTRFIISENAGQRAIVFGDYLLLHEKDVVDPCYLYFYNSRKLIAGRRLYNYVLDPRCAQNLIDKALDLKELFEFESFFRSYVDPKEQLIGEKDREWDKLDRQLASTTGKLESLLNSWSWRITRPLRWIYGKAGKKKRSMSRSD